LSGLVIPIGINIYDVPGRQSSRGDVSDLSFYDRSCADRSNELSVSELGPDQHAKGFFCRSKISPLRSYSEACIKLSIDDEEMIGIVWTRDKNIHLLKILDLCNFDRHYDLLVRFTSSTSRCLQSYGARSYAKGIINDLPIKNDFQTEQSPRFNSRRLFSLLSGTRLELLIPDWSDRRSEIATSARSFF